jgi:lipoate-protein ligase B
LSFFDLIIACEGEPVTSVQKLLGREVDTRAVEDSIVARFGEVFEMELEEDEEKALPDLAASA